MVQLFLTACFCSLMSDAFSEVFVTTLGSVISWSFSEHTSSCDSDVCAKMSKINTMMNEGEMKHLDKINSTYCDHVLSHQGQRLLQFTAKIISGSLREYCQMKANFLLRRSYVTFHDSLLAVPTLLSKQPPSHSYTHIGQMILKLIPRFASEFS